MRECRRTAPVLMLVLLSVVVSGGWVRERPHAQGTIPVVTASPMNTAVMPVTGGMGVVGELRTEVADASLDVGPMPSLAVQNTIGAITLTRSADDAKITVRATKRATSDEAIHRRIVAITRDGDDITIEDGNPGGNISVRNSSERALLPSVDFEIALPRQANLSVRNTEGPVSITGIAGTVEASTNTGAVAISECSGKLTARATSGQLTVRKFEGVLEARTTNGPIAVRDLLGSATVRTTSGTIEVSGTLTNDAPNLLQATSGNITFVGAVAKDSRSHFQVTGGDITLVLPPQSAFALEANTGRGNTVVVDFPLVGTREEGQRLIVSGTIGNPDAAITIRQTSGAIRVLPQT